MDLQQNTRRLLGYAGLIPFVLPVLLLAFGLSNQPWLLTFSQAYAFGIVCFLAGSWWGLALPSNSSLLMALSNGYFLLALVLYLFAPRWWSLAAALLLICIFLTERTAVFMTLLSQSYRRMRAILTLVAATSMLSLQFTV